MKPRTTFTCAPGPIKAAIAAGPAFCAILAVTIYCQIIPQAVPVETGALPATAFILAMSLLFGTAIAIIPCLIGAKLMGALGSRFAFSRLPPFWALVGMVPVGGAAFAIGVDAETVAPVIALLITSAVCALICRRDAEWRDPQPRDFRRFENDPRLLR